MGALDAFYTTWSQARTTFGEGAPTTGDSFDGSAHLREMQSKIESAAPDDRWQGTASQAYAAKNAEHAAVYGKLADLDQRMAAEVSRAADVVNSGRQNLEQTQSWVSSMDASIPPGKTGEITEGGAGTTSKSTIPGQAPNPTGAGPGGVYDPGEPGGYGTSAGGY